MGNLPIMENISKLQMENGELYDLQLPSDSITVLDKNSQETTVQDAIDSITSSISDMVTQDELDESLSNYQKKPDGARLLPGPQFNSTIKQLLTEAGNTGKNIFIQQLTISPGENSTIISTENSEYPIFAWVGGDQDETLYYFTEADRIIMDEDCSYMFSGLNVEIQGHNNINSDIIYWDSSEVKNMSHMFSDSGNVIINEFSFLNWDTSNVTDMSYMFYGSVIALSPYPSQNSFPIEKWDVSNVLTMNSMFSNSSGIILNIMQSWKPIKCLDFGEMFSLCAVITIDNNNAYCGDSYKALNNWNMYLNKSANYDNMLYYNGSNQYKDYRDKLPDWDGVFLDDGTFVPAVRTYLKTGTEITNSFALLSAGESFIHSPNIQYIKRSTTPPPEGVSTYNIAQDGSIPVTVWFAVDEGAGYTTEDGIFSETETDYPLGTLWYYTDATMFVLNSDCEAMMVLPQLKELDWDIYWDMRYVKNAFNMFNNCKSLTEIQNIERWNLLLLRNGRYMFAYSGLTHFDLVSNLNFPTLYEIDYLFYGCSNLTQVTMSNLYVPELMDMNYIFGECTNLTTVSLDNWRFDYISELMGVFYNCSSMVSLSMDGWDDNMDENGMDSAYFNEMCYNCPVKPDWNGTWESDGTFVPAV